MKLYVATLLLCTSLFFSCAQKPEVQIESAFTKGEPISELTDKKLKETSGLIASIKNPGMFWAHNDSGNEPEIYLIDKSLDIKLSVRLVGIENRDWEDIAIGPAPHSSDTFIYVGDIGDNDAVYPYKYIYRLPEPTIGTSNYISTSDFETIVFNLEDGIKDTESLFVDHKSRNLYVISKREEPVWLYEIKLTESDTVTAIKKLSLPFREIVAADYFPATGDILIKNYEHIYFWANTSNTDVVSLLKQMPNEIPYEKEFQGEAIAWATDGLGFYTIGEKKKKHPSFLYFYSKSSK
jgi:hypothetical protein